MKMGNFFEEERFFERKFGSEECPVCLHQVSNPIGVSCYLKHLDIWLEDKGVGFRDRGIVLGAVRVRLPDNDFSEAVCCTCGDEYVGVCSYCFVFIVSGVLGELGFCKEAVEDFEDLFSFKGRGFSIE